MSKIGKLLLIGVVFVLSVTAVSLTPYSTNTVNAAQTRAKDKNETDIAARSDSCNARFLTLPAWYNGLSGTVSGQCQVVVRDMKEIVTRVVINITEIILQLVGYASTIFLIIGGFNYLVSAGDPNKLTAAKSTIMNAVIGLVISLFSVAIINVVAGAL